MFPLVKVSAITPVTATCYSNTWQSLLTCLGHLGQRNINRNDPIGVAPPKVAKASTIKWCCLSLLPMVSLTNVTNVNDPLSFLEFRETSAEKRPIPPQRRRRPSGFWRKQHRPEKIYGFWSEWIRIWGRRSQRDQRTNFDQHCQVDHCLSFNQYTLLFHQCHNDHLTIVCFKSIFHALFRSPTQFVPQ